MYAGMYSWSHIRIASIQGLNDNDDISLSFYNDIIVFRSINSTSLKYLLLGFIFIFNVMIQFERCGKLQYIKSTSLALKNFCGMDKKLGVQGDCEQ